jgi:hypothetical protein
MLYQYHSRPNSHPASRVQSRSGSPVNEFSTPSARTSLSQHGATPYQSASKGHRSSLPVTSLKMEVDWKADASVKPTISYATMITNAINSTDNRRITLNGIYAFIKDNYAYYRSADPSGWQVPMM